MYKCIHRWKGKQILPDWDDDESPDRIDDSEEAAEDAGDADAKEVAGFEAALTALLYDWGNEWRILELKLDPSWGFLLVPNKSCIAWSVDDTDDACPLGLFPDIKLSSWLVTDPVPRSPALSTEVVGDEKMSDNPDDVAGCLFLIPEFKRAARGDDEGEAAAGEAGPADPDGPGGDTMEGTGLLPDARNDDELPKSPSTPLPAEFLSGRENKLDNPDRIALELLSPPDSPVNPRIWATEELTEEAAATGVTEGEEDDADDAEEEEDGEDPETPDAVFCSARAANVEPRPPFDVCDKEWRTSRRGWLDEEPEDPVVGEPWTLSLI